MTAIVIPPERLEEKRREREERRREHAAWAGSILGGLLDDESDLPSSPASPAQKIKETRS